MQAGPACRRATSTECSMVFYGYLEISILTPLPGEPNLFARRPVHANDAHTAHHLGLDRHAKLHRTACAHLLARHCTIGHFSSVLCHRRDSGDLPVGPAWLHLLGIGREPASSYRSRRDMLGMVRRSPPRRSSQRRGRASEHDNSMGPTCAARRRACTRRCPAIQSPVAVSHAAAHARSPTPPEEVHLLSC